MVTVRRAPWLPALLFLLGVAACAPAPEAGGSARITPRGETMRVALAPATILPGPEVLFAGPARARNGSGPESGTDAPVLDDALTGQGQGVACGAGVCVAAWVNLQAGTSMPFVTRVARDGTVLDPYGLQVGPGSEPYTEMFLPRGIDVAFDGTNFMVAYIDSRAGVAGVRVARVTPGGAVLDADGIAVAADAVWKGEVRIGYTGARYVVAWSNLPTGMPGNYTIRDRQDVYAARVETDGTVLDPNGTLLSQDPYRYWNIPLGVTGDGVNALVVWSSMFDGGGGAWVGGIRGARLGPDGAPLEAGGAWIEPDASRATAVVSYCAGRYLLAWGNAVIGSDGYPAGSEAHAQMFDTALRPLARQDFGQGSLSGMAPDDAGWTVAWQGSGATAGVHLTHVEPDGTVTSPAGVLVDLPRTAALAYDGVQFFAQTSSATAPYARMYARRVGRDYAPLDAAAFPVARAGNPQTVIALASDGANVFAAWHESDGAVRAARFDRAGQSLDPAPMALPGADAVAFDGRNYVVAWSAPVGYYRNVVAARVSPAGELLDPAPILVSTDAASGSAYRYYVPAVRVASAGDGTLVVWQEDIYGGSVHAAWMDHDGVVSNRRTLATTRDPRGSFGLALGASRTSYLVVWQSVPGGDRDLFATRLADDGTPLDAAPWVLASGSGAQETPSVGSDGTDFLVAWQNTLPAERSVRATRVSGDGTVRDAPGFVVAGPSGRPAAPSIAFDGLAYGVALQQLRAGSPATDLAVVGVKVAGAVIAAPRVVATSPAGNVRGGRLVAVAPGEFLAGYTRFDPTAPQAERAFVRAVGGLECDDAGAGDAGADGSAEEIDAGLDAGVDAAHDDAGGSDDATSDTADDVVGIADDGGAVGSDAGGSADDAGGSADDAGGSADDAGGSADDAGGSADDAGGSADDAGSVIVDAGSVVEDAGSLVVDASGTRDDLPDGAVAREDASADATAPGLVGGGCACSTPGVPRAPGQPASRGVAAVAGLALAVATVGSRRRLPPRVRSRRRPTPSRAGCAETPPR